MNLFEVRHALFNIYSLKGMILVEGLLDLPIAYLIIAPAMSAFDVSLEESSKVCGASNLRTLFKVTLPVLRPAILASAILVIVRSLASFAVPSVLGMRDGSTSFPPISTATSRAVSPPTTVSPRRSA